MYLKLKKDIFLLILKSLFNDETEEINEENSIEFYHFLLDNLELESASMPMNDDSDFDFILFETVISFLSNFDLLNINWNEMAVLDYVQDQSGLTFKRFSKSISILREVYYLIKLDYLESKP